MSFSYYFNVSWDNCLKGFLEQLYGQNRAFGTVQRLFPNSGYLRNPVWADK